MPEEDMQAAAKLWTDLANERAHFDAECAEA